MFAGYPVIVSFDEASHIWKVPQAYGAMEQEHEHLTVHVPGSMPSPHSNTEFRSMTRTDSSLSSPFHSLSTTHDPAPTFVSPESLQAPMSWIPTEEITPLFDAYGNTYDDGTAYRGTYIPTKRDAENRWESFLLDAGIPPGPPHDSFR